MRATAIAGLLFACVAAACSVKPLPPGEAPQSERQAPAGAPTAPAAATPAPAPVPSTPPAALPEAAAPAEQQPAAPSPAPPSERIAKAAPPAPKAVAKPPPGPAPAAKKEAAPEAAKPTAPPLDLTSLETRLKETPAIGVLTKLALKNQVDDLLDRFRAFYQGKLKTTLAELRRAYDLLVLKVLSLLQDKDPPLATDVAASREAIWGILSDPVKFAAFTSR